MARRAPAVERAVAVLNLLAAHPQQRYTLSEIARDLKLNKATLHAILGALTDEGYLVRDPAAKSYALGPALVALGNSAVSTYPAAECAVPEMRALTDELGLDCVASAAISDASSKGSHQSSGDRTHSAQAGASVTLSPISSDGTTYFSTGPR